MIDCSGAHNVENVNPFKNAIHTGAHLRAFNICMTRPAFTQPEKQKEKEKIRPKKGTNYLIILFCSALD